MTHLACIDMRARGVGELLSLTVSLYRSHFRTLSAIASVVIAPLTVLTVITGSALVAQSVASAANDQTFVLGLSTSPAVVLIALCTGGLALAAGALTPWMGGALIHNVIERALGRAPSARDSYRATLPRWSALWAVATIRNVTLSLLALPLLASAYAVYFATLVSTAVGPGEPVFLLTLSAALYAICLPLLLVSLVAVIWLAVAWVFSELAVIGEGAGVIQAFSRSDRLTRGFRWPLLGRLLLFWAIQFVAAQLPLFGLVLLTVAGFVGTAEGRDASILTLPGVAGTMIFGIVVGVLLTPLNVVYITLNYLDLRVRKEQLDLQLRAAQNDPAVAVTLTGDDGSAQLSDASIEAAPSAQASPVESVSAQAPVSPQMAPTSPASIDPSLPPGQRISLLFNRIRTQGPSAELLNELGLAYQQVGDYDGALDALARAWQLSPSDPAIVYNLALLHRDRNNLSEARRMMTQYLQLESDPAERQRVLNNPRLRNLLPRQM